MSGSDGVSSTALVRSTADPEPELLLFVRFLLQRDEDLRALFVQFKAEQKPVEWLRDMLIPRVAVGAPESSWSEIVGVCQYLADEYHQLATSPGTPLDNGWFLVDEVTGRVRAVVTDDDLHDPGVLPRELGVLGQALPRLKPPLEVALVTGQHERAREGDTALRLVERARQTDLLRDEGDGRLRVASRSGRTGIAKELAEDDPVELMRRAGGSAGTFLRHFDTGAAVDTKGLACVTGVACCRSILGIQDMTTINLGYNRLGALRSIAPQAWARDIARQLSYHVKEHARGLVPIDVEDVTDELFASQEIWVSDPDVYSLLGVARRRIFPVESAETVGLSGCVGSLLISRELAVHTREVSDRWEVTATVPYTLYVALPKIQTLPIVGVARASSMETA